MSHPKETFALPGPDHAVSRRGRRSVLLAGVGLLIFGSLARGSTVLDGQADPNRGDRTDLGEPARLAALCSGSNAIGVGLKGAYYTTEGLRGEPAATRTDTTVEFSSLQELSKAAGLDRIGSVRWTGWIKAHVTGRFRFDGGSPQVGVAVSNLPMSGMRAAPDAEIQLLAGRYYPIEVELDRIVLGQPPIRLQWTVPYGAHYLVPRQALFLPTDSVTPSRTQ